MDYVVNQINNYIIYQKLSFYKIRKAFIKQKIILSKRGLLNRIKEIKFNE